MRGAMLCFSHNPAAAKMKHAAVVKGGRNRHIPARARTPAKPVTIRSVGDVQHLLFRTIEELRNGSVDVDVARTVGYLAGVVAKVTEVAELEERLQKLEKNVAEEVSRMAS